MWKTLRRPKVPHKLIYGILAVLYAASCFIVDKTIVSALIATGYTMLALD